MDRGVAGGLQTGNLGLSRRQERAPLSNVDLGAEARLEADAREVHALLLSLDVLARDRQPLLGTPHLREVAGHLGEQDHEHITPRVLGRLHGGVRGLDRAADPPPEIELPARVQPDEEEVVLELEPGRAGLDVLAVPHAGRRPRRIDRGHPVRRRDATKCPRFPDASRCHLQVKVCRDGLLDQAIEDGILERLPPGGHHGHPRAHPGLIRLAPGRRNGDLRPVVVRPDGAPDQERREKDDARRAARRHDGPRAVCGRSGPGAIPPTAF